MSKNFSLITLNTFGLPFYLGYNRIAGLCYQINQLSSSVLCLQEIQQSTYIRQYQKRLKIYPHFAFHPGRFAPSGGLLTISQLPYEEVQFLPYPDRGDPLSIGFADWFLHKGILKITMEISGQKIIVMNTHLQANYRGQWNSTNPQAKTQLNQFSFLLKTGSQQPDDALVILCGDFNFHRHTYVYDEILKYSSFIDPLINDERGTYKPLPFVSSEWSLPIDFILYRQPSNTKLAISADIMSIEDNRKRLPFQRFLTDHKAIILTAELP